MSHLQGALDLNNLGFSVFPLPPREKKSAIKWQDYQTERPSEAMLRRWWSNGHGEDNIAVVCGAISGVVVVDIDGDAGAESLADLQRKHGGFPTTWRSITGKGEHIWFRYPNKSIRNTVCKIGPGIDIRGDGGYVVAPGSIHPNGSEYAWQSDCSPSEVPLADLPEWVLTALQKPETPKETRRTSAVDPNYKYCRAILENQRAELASISSGARNSALNIAALKLGGYSHYAAYSRSEAELALTAACEGNGLLGEDGAGSVAATFKSGWEAGQSDPKEIPNRDQPTPSQEIIEAPEEWETWLIRTEKGGLTSGSSQNAGLLLKHNQRLIGRLAYDEFHQSSVSLRRLPWDREGIIYPRQITDADGFRAAAWLESCGQMGIGSKNALNALICISEENTFNPLQDYLLNLQWDGINRIDSWLTKYLGVEANVYTIAVGRRFLVGSIARAMRPGCKMDTMLIFEGDQGIGKSTASRVLFGDEYFSDSLSPIGSKDAAQELSGKWCHEIAELGQFVKVDQRHIKEMLSKCGDRFRLPYGRVPREFPRQCVFVGTYNPTGIGPFKDETGGRRFWPVKCGIINLTALAADRNQLWAEALIAFQAGERWWLEGEEIGLAQGEQAERFDEDAWQGAIDDFLTGRSHVTTHEILTTCLSFDLNEIHDGYKTRVARVLTALRWIGKVERVTGKSVRVYRPKTGTNKWI